METDINGRNFISSLRCFREIQRQIHFMMIFTTLTESCGTVKNEGVGTGCKTVNSHWLLGEELATQLAKGLCSRFGATWPLNLELCIVIDVDQLFMVDLRKAGN